MDVCIYMYIYIYIYIYIYVFYGSPVLAPAVWKPFESRFIKGG